MSQNLSCATHMKSQNLYSPRTLANILGISPKAPKKVHLIGVGGIGISALARWFLAQNWAVSGSDLASSSVTQELVKEGVRLKIGHSKANIPPGTSLVIHNPAIRPENPEIQEAVRRGITPIVHTKIIGRITREFRTICVAGSHGKSTTTSMIAVSLTRAQKDPTVIVGTKLREFGGSNTRIGHSPWFVLESDEYSRSFLNYEPSIAVVTNIDREHLDTYRSLADLKKTFLAFLAHTRPGGSLVLNADDRNLASLKRDVKRIANARALDVRWYSTHSPYARSLAKKMRAPGAHNLSNACAAYEVGRIIGVGRDQLFHSLGSYRGAWRRMEYKGMARFGAARARVFDDYAHHPTEIRATLQGFRSAFPKTPIICVFQPHQSRRLDMFFKEFARAFNDADGIVLLPTYEVAGRDGVRHAHTAEELAHTLTRRFPKKSVAYVDDLKRLSETISSVLYSISHMFRPSSFVPRTPYFILIMMGAGSIAKLTPLLLAKKKPPKGQS